jgi:hypothetical protein
MKLFKRCRKCADNGTLRGQFPCSICDGKSHFTRKGGVTRYVTDVAPVTPKKRLMWLTGQSDYSFAPALVEAEVSKGKYFTPFKVIYTLDKNPNPDTYTRGWSDYTEHLRKVRLADLLKVPLSAWARYFGLKKEA